MPESTLLAFADHGVVPALLDHRSGDTAAAFARFIEAGIDLDALGRRLQEQGADAFVTSWNSLIERIASKGSELLATR
jgi:transaldolase